MNQIRHQPWTWKPLTRQQIHELVAKLNAEADEAEQKILTLKEIYPGRAIAWDVWDLNPRFEDEPQREPNQAAIWSYGLTKKDGKWVCEDDQVKMLHPTVTAENRRSWGRDLKPGDLTSLRGTDFPENPDDTSEEDQYGFYYAVEEDGIRDVLLEQRANINRRLAQIDGNNYAVSDSSEEEGALAELSIEDKEKNFFYRPRTWAPMSAKRIKDAQEEVHEFLKERDAKIKPLRDKCPDKVIVWDVWSDNPRYIDDPQEPPPENVVLYFGLVQKDGKWEPEDPMVHVTNIEHRPGNPPPSEVRTYLGNSPFGVTFPENPDDKQQYEKYYKDELLAILGKLQIELSFGPSKMVKMRKRIAEIEGELGDEYSSGKCRADKKVGCCQNEKPACCEGKNVEGCKEEKAVYSSRAEEPESCAYGG